MMLDENTPIRRRHEILVVDDTKANLELLVRILTTQGYRVRPASSGRLALESVRVRLPDLILLDVKLGDIDGFEVCRRLKADEKSRNVPVLFVSVLKESPDKLKGFTAGGVDYITKPFVADEVLARVAKHLRLHDLSMDLEEKVRELGKANARLAEEVRQREVMADSLRITQFAVDHASDCIFWIRPDATFANVNEASCKRLGYTREELLRMSVFDVDPAFPHEAWDGHWREIRERKSLTFETKHKTRSGEVFAVEVSVNFVECEGAEYTFAFARDISKRKQAEEALLRLNDELELRVKERTAELRAANDVLRLTQFALDNAGDAVLWLRKDASIFYVNKAVTELVGRTQAELLTMKAYDLNPAHGDFAWVSHWAEVEQQRVLRFEAELIHKEGGRIPVEITANYIEFADQKYNCAFVRDITERKHAEEEREKLQEQLTQAQKMESVGRLAGGVAHDFNNNLGVILGYAELAQQRVGPADPLCAALDEIRKAAERSANLTRQLLAFASKQTVVPRVLDLNETVEGMLKMLRRLIGEDIDLAWMPGGNIGPVFIDPSQVDQILANLCVNARDAIAGTGKVTIETESVTFDEDYCARHADFFPMEYVLLAVSDNGCGMVPETLAKVFEPFFTTKEVGKGTGLGLATVHGIVKQNNGVINVYSEPGHGTTFRIYLPRHEAKAVPRQKEDHALALAPTAGGETILLVEDEPAILKMAKCMLESMGYAVNAAGTPMEAIRLARDYKGHIDLLMTDVVMPEMNGLDLASNLMSIYPDLKCLFMSGYTANVIAHHGVLDEGVHFIHKPFSTRELSAKIREALSREKSTMAND